MTASDGDVCRGDDTCHSLKTKREHSLALLLSIAKRSKLYFYLSPTKFVEIITIREWVVDTTVYQHHPRQALNLENWGFWHGRIHRCLL